MAKRSNFERNPRDLYETTDPNAVAPLFRHLKELEIGEYVEPCAGSGQLIANIAAHSVSESHDIRCLYACDIHPLHPMIEKRDGATVRKTRCPIITNPPWRWPVFHPLLDSWLEHAPEVWLLLHFDAAANLRMARFMEYCERVQPTARIKWKPGSPHCATDNSAWYRFVPYKTPTTLYPRF